MGPLRVSLPEWRYPDTADCWNGANLRTHRTSRLRSQKPRGFALVVSLLRRMAALVASVAWLVRMRTILVATLERAANRNEPDHAPAMASMFLRQVLSNMGQRVDCVPQVPQRASRLTFLTMNRTSKTRQKSERYADCHGVRFDEYRDWLPERVSDWKQIVRVDDPVVCARMHGSWANCWECGGFRGWEYIIEAHHIVGGTKGRADEFCNIAMLCRECHSNANTAKLPMGRILFIKWKWDRQHVDWVRLALLKRSFLPDLITD